MNQSRAPPTTKECLSTTLFSFSSFHSIRVPSAVARISRRGAWASAADCSVRACWRLVFFSFPPMLPSKVCDDVYRPPRRADTTHNKREGKRWRPWPASDLRPARPHGCAVIFFFFVRALLFPLYIYSIGFRDRWPFLIRGSRPSPPLQQQFDDRPSFWRSTFLNRPEQQTNDAYKWAFWPRFVAYHYGNCVAEYDC